MIATDSRLLAVEAYVQALRTGEASSTARVAPYLADDVSLSTGPLTLEGHAAVLDRVSGQWPTTIVLAQAVWSEPIEEDGRIVTSAEFPGMGAAPGAVKLAFSFAPDGRISRVEQQTTPQPVTVVDRMPVYIQSLVNNALKNSCVMVVSYVDADGLPSLSLRGSVQTYGDTALSIWVRNANGGIAAVARAGGAVGLMYRDSRVRTTLSFLGHARLETDETARNLIYDRIPEVEQRHDLDRKGAAIVIELDRLVGGTFRGGIRLERKP